MKFYSNLENQRLSRIGMVTYLGDFISLFAILLLLEKSGIGPEYSGINIIGQAFAYSLSAVAYPYLSSKFTTKKLIFFSQLFSLISSSTILGLYITDHIRLIPFIICTLSLTFFYQMFDNAKNHHSKLLNSTSSENTNSESQLLSYFFGAQTIGPIISIVLLKVFPIWVPLLFDLVTFVICMGLATQLQAVNTLSKNTSVFRPLRYIWKYPRLRNITLLRSIGFWFGAGIFDYLMFPAIKNTYGISISNCAFIYSALGFGAAIGVAAIRNPLSGGPSILSKYPMWIIACIGNLGISVAMILFWQQASFLRCLMVSVFHGIFMGLLANSSQSIRKIESTADQFPEIVSFEILIGRLLAGLLPLAIFSSITKYPETFDTLKYIPSLSSMAVAVVYIFCFGKHSKERKELAC